MRSVDRLNALLKQVPAVAVYVAGVLPAIWLFWQAITGTLSIEPIKSLEHETGELGLQLLIATLLVTPLRRFTGINLLRLRRALGLLAFFYIALHLLIWLLLDVQDPAMIWADVVKRPYITVGMLGFVLLVPLAITSNNRSIRVLGRRWHALHRLAYVAIPLGGLHFVMQAKGLQIEPLVYLGVIFGLLFVRLSALKRRRLA
ncbi:sulfoxide reductase heme-binding subunit YedZ [Poseidonocella pacifica]|uniref:Protein-methionine-sulfoxide reductase heme-binding subunit MsrQ n=1 Tax=Poseidonocella pacifica TaxID=871651 RepID=A0A1I0XSA9_9RHOB|nr:protein-methionine-sulfoxide reductase heme-binding subunit MsrQ [Poseidonocella pacifica]SFB03945.1 sulfoxide reductase heme-binding subunit YedZ [Poseidonocella pacifica]